MRVPVYNYEMELLTLVYLAPWAVAMVEKDQAIALKLEMPMPVYCPDKQPSQLRTLFVILRGFRIEIGFRAHRRASWFLVCGDETNALLLKSSFAPGQKRAVNQRESDAFGEGISAAFRMLGGLSGDQG